MKMDILKIVCMGMVMLMSCGQAFAVPTKGKVLVLVDDLDVENSHSMFLGKIRNLGFDVTVSLATDEDVGLKEHDAWLFDKLVVLGGASSRLPGVMLWVA